MTRVIAAIAGLRAAQSVHRMCTGRTQAVHRQTQRSVGVNGACGGLRGCGQGQRGWQQAWCGFGQCRDDRGIACVLIASALAISGRALAKRDMSSQRTARRCRWVASFGFCLPMVALVISSVSRCRDAASLCWPCRNKPTGKRRNGVRTIPMFWIARKAANQIGHPIRHSQPHIKVRLFA